MSNGIKIPTVREHVSPQDSAAVLDYMVDVLGFPEDIHDFYSKDIGHQPLNFHLNEMLKKENIHGQVSYGSPGYHTGYEDAHTAIDTLITKSGTPLITHTAVDTTYTPYHGSQKEKSTFGKQLAEITHPFVVSPEYLSSSVSPRQTTIHEVFGHLLPRRYRADEKLNPADASFPTWYGKSELMAELLETIVAEEGDTSAAKLKDYLEPIVQKELKKELKGNIPASYKQNPNIRKRRKKLDQFLETIQGWFGY